MPRVKTTAPEPSREKGRRSLDLPLYLNRILPLYINPEWLNAEIWRNVVMRQPLAVVCRETLIANLISLDWKIEPRDSTKRDENKSEIQYYEKFFENTGDYDYTEIMDWLVADLLDIPFGGAAEIGRESDSPSGRILWMELLDGATLFPTLNADFPVGQRIKEDATRTVYFPTHAVNRMYFSPRRELKRKGWGMAPPEKIYLSLELLNRGDVYYANLLLDTPAAGILDLGDMAKDSAEEWLKSWRDMLGGVDPFKIPVLYEHEKAVSWIPFTRSPADLMFDKALSRYGALVTAGYGMGLSDIGVPSAMSGGETLAGTIREERRTRRTGFARLKKKVKFWFDRILPEYLEFKFIDLDDELNVALGRARLATSTAFQQLVSMGAFTAEELRQQIIADGLITISVPETLPPEAKKQLQANNPSTAERPTMLGRPVAPSSGGYGEVKSKIIKDIKNTDNSVLLRNIYRNFPFIKAEVDLVSEALGEDVLPNWDYWYDKVLTGNSKDAIPEITMITLSNIKFDFSDFIKIPEDDLISETKNRISSECLVSLVDKGEKEFISGKSAFLPNSVSIEKYQEAIELKTRDYVSDFKHHVIDALGKGTISGTRKFILDNPKIETPDQLLETNVLSYVKLSIDGYINATVRLFENIISDIIQNMIEGDNSNVEDKIS
jgi:hypothetical protein